MPGPGCDQALEVGRAVEDEPLANVADPGRSEHSDPEVGEGPPKAHDLRHGLERDSDRGDAFVVRVEERLPTGRAERPPRRAVR